MTQTATRALPANLQGGLIVSCQALADEPLHSSFIMGRMALAAAQGGAAGIRANSAEDIRAIRENVNLPIIGIIKRDYPDSEVFITATMREVDELMTVAPEIIAIDARDAPRPGGQTLAAFVAAIRAAYPEVLLMADCASLAEMQHADALASVKRPIIAEGNINTPEKVRRVLALGVYSVVVGSAITRPKWITEQFVQATKP